jgi:hypothetical protein
LVVKYKNLSKNSGISECDIESLSIAVTFFDGGKYFYTYSSAGSIHVEEMKSLAYRGYGLNTYISKYVRNRYQYKQK